MLTILFLLLATFLCFVGYDKTYSEFFSIGGFMCFGTELLFCILLFFTHIPPIAKQKQIEVMAKYQTITQAIAEDSQNTVVLAGEIAEYNSEVLKGRYAMHSAWLSFQEYSFWDDVPLIGLEGEFE